MLKRRLNCMLGSILLTIGLLSGLFAQVRQEWVVRYNGYGNAFDVPTVLTVDQAGNVYVAGYSDNVITIIKYAANGTQLWAARYLAQPGRVRAITLDAAGNVYVTGRGGNDYLTLKYASDGTLLWAATYNGYAGEYSEDEAVGIAVDSEGNVYVTGTSDGGATGRDIATIKYDANGNQLWVARYGDDGSASGEEARAIAVDEAGNIYVCGRSSDPTTFGVSCVTIKYDSDGNPLWIAHFSGMGAAFPAALRLDHAGNPLLACTTLSGDPENLRMAIVTLKYSVQGDLIWAAYHNASSTSRDRASALAVDRQGNIYVVGTTRKPSSSEDIVLVKYDPNGNLLWSDCYNSPQDRSEAAAAIALDPAGNVLVMGRTASIWGEPVAATLLKYTRDGVRQWGVQYLFDNSVAPALGVDANGNATLTGSSQWDFITVQFNPIGQKIWIAQYNGPGWTSEGASGVLLDRSGNVLVLGSTYNGYCRGDVLVHKYTPVGRLIWEDRYGTRDNETPSAFALDNADNLYVAGFVSDPSGAAADCLLMKYDSQGNRLWVVRYDSPDQVADRARILVVDPSGYSYVVGETFNAGANKFNLLILRYDPSGNLLWARRDEEGIYPDHAVQDPFGNLYVAAIADSYSYLAKYSPSGERLWHLTLAGWSWKLAVDSSSNLYAAGHAENRYILAKYSPGGRLLWLDSRPVTTGATPWVQAIQLDGRGNLYLTMRAGQHDALTLKYTVEGNLIWERRFSGPAGSENAPRGIAVDVAGSVYVSIHSAFQATQSAPYHADWYTIKYEPDGREAWVIRFDGELEYDDDDPAQLVVDRTGNVYVVGSALMYSDNTAIPSTDLILIKYSQPPIGDVDENGCVEDSDLLALLSDFGRQGSSLATDINRDGVVDDADLLILLFNFGAGC